jgi:hypothetical protein
MDDDLDAEFPYDRPPPQRDRWPESGSREFPSSVRLMRFSSAFSLRSRFSSRPC